MPEYITNDIEISSNDSDEGSSNEENSDRENSNELLNRISVFIAILRQLKKYTLNFLTGYCKNNLFFLAMPNNDIFLNFL